MSLQTKVVAFGGIVLLAGSSLMAAPVGVDGAIGSDWSGVTPVNVTFNAAAGGFSGGPYNGTAYTPYNVYVRDDGNYYYVALQSTANTAGLDFTNLYLGTATANGAILGFEVQGNRAFIPGVSTGGNDGLNDGYYNYTAASGIVSVTNVSTGSTTVEFAVPNSFFTTNPLGIQPHGQDLSAYTAADPVYQVRDSQSFGYSYTGGASYGPARLGQASVAAVPEPTSVCLIAVSALGLLGRRRGAGAV